MYGALSAASPSSETEIENSLNNPSWKYLSQRGLKFLVLSTFLFSLLLFKGLPPRDVSGGKRLAILATTESTEEKSHGKNYLAKQTTTTDQATESEGSSSPEETPTDSDVKGTKVKHNTEIACEKDFGEIAIPNEKADRLPSSFTKVSVNLWDHPYVISKLGKLTAEEQQSCVQEGNIDVWINNEAMTGNLANTPRGHTVFHVDCRNTIGRTLIGFVVVLSTEGKLTAVTSLAKGRAESVNMKDTKTVLFSAGNSGVYLWDWKNDVQEPLPFFADSHSLWYSKPYNAYFGMETPSATQKNAPSVATAFDTEGGQLFKYVQDGSHINYISVGDGVMYLSARSEGSLAKVNIDTLQTEWVLGGPGSDFMITGIDGKEYDPKEMSGEDSGAWRHQHKFQHLDDSHFSLFDNHVLEDRSFVDGESSRMVILKVDQESKTAQEVFAFETGDQAVVYGGADVLPSGNVLGSSYPDFVYPEIPDRSYHQNIWEVTPGGEIAWRASFKGPNPKNVNDQTSPFSHRISACDEPPIGWVIFNVERFYEQPLISTPCRQEGNILFKPYNTIRTQSDQAGVASLLDPSSSEVVSEVQFSFQKSWLQQNVEISVPKEQHDKELSLKIVNEWKDTATISIGSFNDMPICDSRAYAQLFDKIE